MVTGSGLARVGVGVGTEDARSEADGLAPGVAVHDARMTATSIAATLVKADLGSDMAGILRKPLDERWDLRPMAVRLERRAILDRG